MCKSGTTIAVMTGTVNPQSCGNILTDIYYFLSIRKLLSSRIATREGGTSVKKENSGNLTAVLRDGGRYIKRENAEKLNQ